MTSYVSMSGRYAGNVTLTDPAFSPVCTNQTCTGQHCTQWTCPSGPPDQCTDYPCTSWTCTSNSCAPPYTCTSTDSHGNCTKCGYQKCCSSPYWQCTSTGPPCLQKGACDQCNGNPPCTGGTSCPGWNCNNWQCDTYTCTAWNTFNYEAWTFTTGSTPTHIDLTLDGTWSNSQANSYLAIFNSTDFTKTPVTSNTGNPATLSYDLAANTTYYVAVSPNSRTSPGLMY